MGDTRKWQGSAHKHIHAKGVAICFMWLIFLMHSFNESQWHRPKLNFREADRAGRIGNCLLNESLNHLLEDSCHLTLTINLGRKIKIHEVSNNNTDCLPTRRCHCECGRAGIPHPDLYEGAPWRYVVHNRLQQSATGVRHCMRYFTVCICYTRGPVHG